MKEESASFVRKALDIINRHVILGPVFQIKESGDAGPVMEAANLLRQALALEPDNAGLHYAYVGALRLAAQFGTAEEENSKLITLHPDYALAEFSSEAWSTGSVISPAPFAYPEWTTTATALPDYYTDKLKNFTLFPAREGILARAVLFEKDTDGWWTKEKLGNVRAQTAVVLVPGHPNIAAIYKRCTGPGLDKPDMQESLVVLDVPKDDLSLVGWEYLIETNFTDVVVVDRSNNVVFNQRVPVSTQTKTTLGRIRDVLLNTRDRKISNQEMLTALQRYQGAANLDDIEKRYF